MSLQCKLAVSITALQSIAPLRSVSDAVPEMASLHLGPVKTVNPMGRHSVQALSRVNHANKDLVASGVRSVMSRRAAVFNVPREWVSTCHLTPAPRAAAIRSVMAPSPVKHAIKDLMGGV